MKQGHDHFHYNEIWTIEVVEHPHPTYQEMVMCAYPRCEISHSRSDMQKADDGCYYCDEHLKVMQDEFAKEDLVTNKPQ